MLEARGGVAGGVALFFIVFIPIVRLPSLPRPKGIVGSMPHQPAASCSSRGPGYCDLQRKDSTCRGVESLSRTASITAPWPALAPNLRQSIEPGAGIRRAVDPTPPEQNMDSPKTSHSKFQFSFQHDPEPDSSHFPAKPPYDTRSIDRAVESLRNDGVGVDEVRDDDEFSARVAAVLELGGIAADIQTLCANTHLSWNFERDIEPHAC